jgi:hypothetical protein
MDFFNINSSLGTVTPGLPFSRRGFILSKFDVNSTRLHVFLPQSFVAVWTDILVVPDGSFAVRTNFCIRGRSAVT